MELFSDKSSNPKRNAQLNLEGRTHYVDEGTLRYHHSRILQARAHDNGLLFSIITTDALDMHNTKRGYRFVVFDVFGTVLARPKIEETFTTKAAADKARYAFLNTVDAKAHTYAAIEKARESYAAELRWFAESMERATAQAA